MAALRRDRERIGLIQAGLDGGISGKSTISVLVLFTVLRKVHFPLLSIKNS